MNILKKQLLNIFRKHFTGKKKLQRFFNFMRSLAAQGLNFGNGGSIEISGEIALIKYLAGLYTEQRRYVIFDVGANRGDYTLELIKNIITPNLQIWCFEPSVDTFEKLKNNISGKSGVILNNIGLGITKNKLPLYTDKPGSYIASLYPLERAYGNTERLSKFELVSIETLDSFLTDNDIPYVDFLKLDIEGNELNALMGAANSIKAGKIKAIQFEFGTCNIDSRTYFRDFWYLLSDQYNIFRLVKDGLYPINYYSEYDEIFATINYYAELK